MVAGLRPAYRAVAERDGSWWAIRVPELRGVYSQARRLADVEAMARDALALVLDLASDTFDVSVEPVLGSDAAGLVEQALAGRLEAEQAARRASEQLRAAVDCLAASGLTVRDIAHILGLSHQRIAQVSNSRRTVAADEARSPSPDARPGRASEPPAAYDRSVDAILGSILRRIVEAYQPEAVYLFGSRARHQADADSDYDLLVVVPADAPEARRRPQLAVRALRGVGVPVDAVVMTRPAFDLRAHVVNSLPEAALHEGRLLYGA
jgi:predicted nucleotidyltransferase/predicted RNase H-like HicB family nuclease